MSLYPIHYFDDKDYDIPEIAIFHAHYPHIKIQYAEISFRMLGDYSIQGAEFQIIDCTSDYLLFTLSIIWRQCFGGAELERAEAKALRKRLGETNVRTDEEE